MKTKAHVLLAEGGLDYREIEISGQANGDEKVLDVLACGYCGNDHHFIEDPNGIPLIKKGWVPFMVPGHEIYAQDLSGQKYIVPAVLTCGRCNMCRNGRSNLCENERMIGRDINGGFAMHIHIPRAYDLCPVSEEDIANLRAIGCPERNLAVMADAMTTAYNAVENVGKLRPFDRVLVVGSGGVGINVVQFAAAAGAVVVAADINDVKANMAMDFGAVRGINTRREGDPRDIFREIRQEVYEALGGPPTHCFEVAGHPDAYGLAAGLCGKGGQIIVVGFTLKKTEYCQHLHMAKGQNTLGAYGCPPHDYPRVLHMVTTGMVNLKDIVTKEVLLPNLSEAFEEQKNPKTIRTLILPYEA
ncbi:MAG: zinc-binding dehydrogenase [Patescibacteria group bacterium]